MSGFVHLHLHTQYSIYDGAIRLKPLFSEIAQREVKAVAITDHGVMHGAVDFINKSKGTGVKPILGCELNIDHVHPDSPDKLYHLTAICRTLQGYRNALDLLSKANIENYDSLRGFGTVKFEWLKDRAEGLTILSGDLGGELPQMILRGGDVDGVMRMMRETFEPGQFYLEMMDNSFEAQKKVNAYYKAHAKAWELPLVATNDCHYMKREEAFAHACLVCMSLDKKIDPDVLREYVVDDFYVKTDEEMYAAFADVPEACENTVKIAEEVDCPVSLGPIYLPQYKVPHTFVEERGIEDVKTGIHEYFKEVARTGLEARLASFKAVGKEVDEKVYWERLEREIGVITQMDFPGYFLIVWDFINWAKRNGIPVGPGRGSGAGSLVAYSMTITDLDPLPFSLLFERFLNPERVSMPDFDVDFCMDRRGEVIKYVTELYGVNNVAQIATFGALKAKAAIKGVGRVMNFFPSETAALCKLVPEDLKITLKKALDDEPKLKEIYETDARVKEMYDTAIQVEDLFCQTGMHAAGIVISEGPLWDYVPIFRGKNGEIVAQYAKAEVEQAGLVKFDFLGLKTLTVLQTAMEYVNQTRASKGQEPLDISTVPLDDKAVYRLITSGNTTGIFQIESPGFTKLMMQIKPDCFEDVIAAVALFRPGPMGSGMLDQFVDCKHGRREIEYPHECLSGILKETYGVFVYQEQVMQAAQIMSGYSLGGADIMRRAMGKKKPEEMAKQRGIFVEGAIKNNIDGTRAGEIFDLIEKFAGYGFNKSHSAAYALITYQTAYLKKYYPVELYAALMTCDQDKPDKVIRTINDARANGIKVLPPDVNRSALRFSVVDGRVLFGLAGIKGVGEAALESVFATREKDGPFKSMFDFCNRVDSRVNKKVLEALVMSGAFDSLWPGKLRHIGDIGAARASMFASIQTALDRSKQHREDKSAGQTSLFSLFSAQAPKEAASLDDKYTAATPWPEETVLENEFRLIGYFVSGHPLDHYRQEIKMFSTHETNALLNVAEGTRVSICGMYKGASVRTTKSGSRMASGAIEDFSGQVKFICFQKSLEKIGEDKFAGDNPVILTGRLKFEGDNDGETDNRQPEIMVDFVDFVSDVRARRITHIQFKLTDEHKPEDVETLHSILSNPIYQGTTHAYIKYETGAVDADLRLPYRVNLTDEFLRLIDQTLGLESYAMR
ncbi:MAG: DNA polymerase III subunit alpha [Proteobacteria bacterium]|nr:DNA polymerase III subunit alpha [Pseudomonadota bacterium]